MRRVRWLPVVGLSAVAAIGCGDGPELATVEGVVRLDGRPLDGATIVFTPIAGGRPSGARTDGDRRYELVYTVDEPGALPGEHFVSVSTYRPHDPDSGRIGAPERVPTK